MKRAIDEPSTSTGKRARPRLFTAQHVIDNFSDDEGDIGDDYFSSSSSEEEDFDSRGASTDEDQTLDLDRDADRLRGERGGRGPVVNMNGEGQWTNNFVEQTILNFNPNNDNLGPVNLPDGITGDSSPLEFLSLFADDEFWTNVVEKTNLRAEQVRRARPNSYYAKSFQAVSIPEMKAFVGIRIYMEWVLPKLSYRDYWESDGQDFLGFTPGFRKVMTRDRFLAIWSFLHVIDEEDRTIDHADKIYKVRSLLDYFLIKFQKYYRPRKHLSLDEGMIPTKNRLAIKQYIKDKPTKWGIKSFMVCDAESGYVYNVEIYTGRGEIVERELGAVGNTVVRLVKSCELDQKSYVLVMDRYYNSVALADYALKELKTGVVGTIMTNRKQYPKTLKNVKKLKRGESRYLCRDSITCLVWQDRRPIHFISNFHKPDTIETASRRNKDGSLQEVDMPLLVKDYNSFMGGCDKNDQMTRLHRSRKHYKWPRRLFVKFFMWACYNSYVIFQAKSELASKPYFTRYVKQLCLALVADHRTNAVAHIRKEPCDLRLTNGPHFPSIPADTSTNHVCVVCSEKHQRFKRQNPGVAYKDIPIKMVKTSIICTLCEKYLCVKRGSTCWQDWHTKVEYWR